MSEPSPEFLKLIEALFGTDVIVEVVQIHSSGGPLLPCGRPDCPACAAAKNRRAMEPGSN